MYCTLKRCWVLTLLLGFCGPLAAQSLQPVPAFSALVVDQTNTLDEQQKASLIQKLTAFQQRKGSQLAVLMVATTRPEEIEPFATRVFDQWKPGRGKVNDKWVDDGALLLIAKDDRRMHLEVGYGLEGALTDATSKRIIDETIRPLFRTGDFAGGINAGVDQILKVIDGESLPPPQPRPTERGHSIGNGLPFLIFVVFGLSATLRQFLGRGGGAVATGAVTGILAWVLSHFLPVALLAGGMAFFFSLVLGLGGGGWSSTPRSGGWGGFGGLGGGGFGGGFGGGGFGGGGGGRSGGGGASGSW
jgi:uncharacterized protein